MSGIKGLCETGTVGAASDFEKCASGVSFVVSEDLWRAECGTSCEAA